METQEPELICLYADGGQTLPQMIDSSFTAFLQRELQNGEQHPPVHESWA